jgi:hypothetical protein
VIADITVTADPGAGKNVRKGPHSRLFTDMPGLDYCAFVLKEVSSHLAMTTAVSKDFSKLPKSRL